MKITIIGAGPGGSFAAHQLSTLGHHVTVYEKRPEDDRTGLGITVDKGTVDLLSQINPSAFSRYRSLFSPQFTRIEKFLEDQTYGVDKSFPICGVKRSEVVDYLRKIAADAGAHMHYDVEVDEDMVLREKNDCQLLIAADGAKSVVRSAMQMEISEIVAETPFIWLPVEGALPHLINGVMEYDDEIFYLHAYPDSPNSSTAVIEYSGKTLDNLADENNNITEEGLATLKELFEPKLHGTKLTSDNSKWMYFNPLASRETCREHVFLVGEAFARVHYREGAGAVNAISSARKLVGLIYRLEKPENILKAFDDIIRKDRGNQIVRTSEIMNRVNYMGEGYRHDGPIEFFKLMKVEFI